MASTFLMVAQQYKTVILLSKNYWALKKWFGELVGTLIVRLNGARACQSILLKLEKSELKHNVVTSHILEEMCVFTHSFRDTLQ